MQHGDPKPSADDPHQQRSLNDVFGPTGAAQPGEPEAAEHGTTAPDADMTEERWLREVYQGDSARQLSVRSIITGMLIGGVMSISNLYVGLKTGWGLGVTITACIIAYAVFKSLELFIPAYRRDPFSMLENYTMSSAASAAGYMASAGLVSSIPALFLTEHIELEWWKIMSWLAAVSTLGVFMAIPLKRQMINLDKLPFPSGIATAETLRSMHTTGAEAVHKARALFAMALGGGLLAFWRDAFPLIGERLEKTMPRLGKLFNNGAFPEEFPLFPGKLGKTLLEKQTLGFEGSLIMIAAGAIMGIRVGVSLLIGSVFFYGILGGWLVDAEITGPAYGGKGINSWTLWPATAMMVASGLLAFALRWRTVFRAFSGLASIFGAKKTTNDPLAHIEVPGWWFAVGTGISGLACVILAYSFFDVVPWMGLVAVVLTFLLSIVAARATGETDVTPTGAMGKITQLTYAWIAPADKVTNLMTASITAGAASHSADLLTDLKSGYLLGGNPRKQTISQLFGVLAGTLFCVPVYAIIADPKLLGTKDLPAPAAKVWAGVADVLAKGFDSLPRGALAAMIVGGAVGIVLTLLEEFTPKKYRKFIPSATGLGIAGVVPAFNSISMFVGALAAWSLSKASPKLDEKYTVAASSGLIAGESLMGVAVKLTVAAPSMFQKLFSWWA